MIISENLKILEERIAGICESCGRKRSEIRLIGVSKTQTVDMVKEAVAAGIVDLGENKAQELRDKSVQIDYKINWHFIGHLQTNKVKFVIKPAEFIHSVDSIKLAEEINNKAGQINKVQNVLLEVKTSDEESKFGMTGKDKIFEVAEFCKDAENINLCGLMTIAPFVEDQKVIRNSFKNLRTLKEELNRSRFGLMHLSMGMTGDFEVAIEEGATILRIGTAIFGSRKKPN